MKLNCLIGLVILSLGPVVFAGESCKDSAHFRSIGDFCVEKTGQSYWAKADENDLSWSEATVACRQLRIGGFSDWQLGSIDELLRFSTLSPEDAFVFNVLDVFWSSTVDANGNVAAVYLPARERLSLDVGVAAGALCTRKSQSLPKKPLPKPTLPPVQPRGPDYSMYSCTSCSTYGSQAFKAEDGDIFQHAYYHVYYDSHVFEKKGQFRTMGACELARSKDPHCGRHRSSRGY